MSNTNEIFIKKKVGFIKSYSNYLLRDGIDINSSFSLVNLKTLLQELSSTISIIVATNKPDHGLKYQLQELTEYLQNNCYFNKNHKAKINQLKLCVGNIKKIKNQFRLEPYELLESVVADFLLDIQDNLFGLNSEIKYRIYDGNRLESSIQIIIKSLISDFLTELLQNGLSIKYLQKSLEETFELTEQGINELTFEKALMKFLDTPLIKDSSVTYVFKILGLKIMLPFQIDDILFYNPMREDLLVWKNKEKLFEDEEYLLSFPDQDILKGIREGQRAISDEVHYIDCHARINIPAKNIKEGFNRALQTVQNTLYILKFNYNLSNIRISENYFALDHTTKMKVHPLMVTDEYTKNRKYDISYYPRGLNDSVIKDLAEQNSSLNLLLECNKSENIEKLSKVLFWYEKGNEATSNHEKFINYWVALEFLIKENKNKSIKSQVLALIPQILVLVSFRNELILLYHYYNNEFSSFGSIGYFPDELKKIEGLEDFRLTLDLKAFADNILEFKEFSSDEYINYRIDCFHHTYNNVTAQKKHFELLKNKFSYLTGRIYRLRNNIVHEALMDENDLAIYGGCIKYCIRILLNNFDSSGSNLFQSWNECSQLFYEWRDKLNKNIPINIL